MWSRFVFVRPSKRRLMPRRVRPYVELPLGLAFAFDFELDGGWYTEKWQRQQ
jgi:hypothetical protein